MTDKGSYTLSSGEAAKAELRELRELAEEMAEALRDICYEEDGGPAWSYPTRANRDIVLARYEALRDG